MRGARLEAAPFVHHGAAVRLLRARRPSAERDTRPRRIVGAYDLSTTDAGSRVTRSAKRARNSSYPQSPEASWMTSSPQSAGTKACNRS